MTAAVLIVSGFMLIVMASVGLSRSAQAARTPRTPLEQAERILAARYARGQLSAQQYQRSVAVLRR
jgi:uncharacterized membrane protein